MERTIREPILYQICVKERLDEQWSGWIDGAAFSYEDGVTVLSCPVADQAALQGLQQRQQASVITPPAATPPVEIPDWTIAVGTAIGVAALAAEKKGWW